MRLLLLSLSIVCVLCACSSEQAAESVDDGRVFVGLLSEPATLNPLAATASREFNIIDLLFLQLGSLQPDLISLKPALAEGWTFSDDSLSVTFRIREGVTWHDGQPVTVDDVLFTFEVQTNPDVAWPGAHTKERITQVEVTGERDITFRFAARYPYQLVDANYGHILPKHLLASVPAAEMRTAEFGRRPVGCGPYRLGWWDAAQFIRLERNPEYHEAGVPALDEVVYRFIPDEAAVMTSLKAREIDCTEFVTPDALAELEVDGDLEVVEYAGREMSFIAWNNERAPFDDPAVRRALAMGIDAAAAIKAAWNGRAALSNGPVPPVLWAHDPSIDAIAHDPAAAQRALNELGWLDADGDGVLERDGKPFEFEMLTNQGNQQRIDAITVVQASLAEVGVKVNLRVLEWNAFMTTVIREGTFDSCLFGYNMPVRVDLKNYWSTGASFNLSRYSNPEVDALIERARFAPTTAASLADWQECQQRIYDDQPHYFLALPNELLAIDRRFCNVEPNVLSFSYNLPQWSVGAACD